MFVIPLDSDRYWYRYHQLFAEVLRNRLRQYAPMELSMLHHRAAEWFERQNLLENAVQHALNAGDHDYAAQRLEPIVNRVLVQENITLLLGWLAMPTVYEIRIEGLLDPCWSEWLEGMTVTPHENGETVLSGPVADQAALHGLLNRICNMNLKLVRVEKKAEL